MQAGFLRPRGWLRLVGVLTALVALACFSACGGSDSPELKTVALATSADGGSDGGDGADGDGGVPECTQNTDCDDGDACNGNETCQSGACQSGTPIVCDDGNWCNGLETCSGGSCISGVPPSCNDGVGCTADSCDEATDSCAHQPDDSACDDADDCTDDSCDPSSGCSHTDVCPQPDGGSGDGDGGTDGGEPDPVCQDNDDCDDQIGCTDDVCEPSSDFADENGCVYNPSDANCNDNVDCTGDSCNPGSGQADSSGCVNTPYDSRCDDGKACTTDSCNAQTGCENTPVDSECDDGFDCTDDACDPTSDFADENGCTNEPMDANCQDSYDCTDDRCDPSSGDADAAGCINQPIDGRCDDQINCTEDSCDPDSDDADTGSGCVFDPEDDNCDDGFECTVDVCDDDPEAQDVDENGCLHDPYDEYCKDHQWCTVNDRCAPGSPDDADGDGCIYDDRDCNDNIECTVDDSCNEAEDKCNNDPNHELCDDDKECTEDVCDPEEGCQYTSLSCDECAEDQTQDGWEVSFGYDAGKKVKCIMLGGDAGANFSISGTARYEPASCEDGEMNDPDDRESCESWAEGHGNFDIDVFLCKGNAIHVNGEVEGRSIKNHCEKCNDDCKKECADENCEKRRIAGKVKVEMSKFLGYKANLIDIPGGRVIPRVQIFVACGATVRGGFGAFGAIERTVDNTAGAEYCPDCPDCQEKEASGMIPLRGSLNCGIKIRISNNAPIKLGCNDCLQLGLETRVGAKKKSGECGNQTCAWARTKGSISAALGPYCFSALRWFKVKIHAGGRAEGRCAIDSCKDKPFYCYGGRFIAWWNVRAGWGACK